MPSFNVNLLLIRIDDFTLGLELFSHALYSIFAFWAIHKLIKVWFYPECSHRWKIFQWTSQHPNNEDMTKPKLPTIKFLKQKDSEHIVPENRNCNTKLQLHQPTESIKLINLPKKIWRPQQPYYMLDPSKLNPK